MTAGVVVVVYVDAEGSELPARTVGYPRPGELVTLVVGDGGIRVVSARYSDDGEPDTWHFPPGSDP